MKPTIEIVQKWTEDVCAHFPNLSYPQAAVLAEASFALMTVGPWGGYPESFFSGVVWATRDNSSESDPGMVW